MSARWVLVDGYSVLHTWPVFLTRKARARTLAGKRDALISLLRQYADHTGHRVTVVFDGYGAKHKPESNEPTAGIEVVYSDKGRTADDVIERFVGQSEWPGNILVVTSDNLERHTVESLGAQSMSAELFAAEADAALRELAKSVHVYSRRERNVCKGRRGNLS
jgi:predicted RNA-binding protein with PIN domain